jgi:hypothetical protein
MTKFLISCMLVAALAGCATGGGGSMAWTPSSPNGIGPQGNGP